MIPIKLTLKNFMSYGDPAVVVPFEGLHVACLAGDNGNGKSAILDGITWALWGKTRASAVRSVSDDDLIRLGADEVEVRFEFDLSGQQYRVVKKRRRGKSSGQDWQLAQRKPDGSYAAIGGGGQRETGRQIVQLLSMEYETFVNSAYLQQGRADEFTRQTPDSRKRILGEILGLDRYDRLEAKARERHRERKEAVEELDREIRMLANEIANLPGYREQLGEVCTALETVGERLREQETLVVQWRARLARLDALAEQVKQVEARWWRTLEEARQRQGEMTAQALKLQQLEQVIEQRDAITGDYQQLQKALKRREALEPQIEQFNKANQMLQTVIGAIELAEKQKQGEIRLVEQQLKHAEEWQRERQGLSVQIAALRQELEATRDLAPALEAAREQGQTLQHEFAELSAANKELAAAITELDEVIALLERPHATCPVCESDLSGAKHARVLARQEEKRSETQRRQKEVQAAGRAKRQALTAAQEALKQLTAQQNERIAQQNRLIDLEAQDARFAEDPADVPALKRQIKALQTELEQGDFALPQRVHRKKLEHEIQGLAMTRSEYETVRQQIQRLEPSRGRFQELEQALGSWDERQGDLERLEREIEDRLKEAGEQEAQARSLRADLAQYEQVSRDTALGESVLRRLQEELNGLKVREGGLHNYIAGCERARAEKLVRSEEHRKVAEESRMYNALAVAFSKKGLQAMIIENTIPELEDEANDLLARMTENEMQVRFKTTRLRKSDSGEIETLDIEVQDDAGQRPYELFSGGEAFRINFAIRIAMSRLLARRSGAKLQTLIMDEGFGSQDGKGREKLIEVIGAIKDDFEKILVITHVEELKDAFTQRIEVTKDAAGSHVHVL